MNQIIDPGHFTFKAFVSLLQSAQLLSEGVNVITNTGNLSIECGAVVNARRDLNFCSTNFYAENVRISFVARDFERLVSELLQVYRRALRLDQYAG